MDNAGQVDMIYLDFSKAFDSVSHKLLLHKIQSFGIHSNLLNWFNSYLSGREQRVVVDGVHSDWLPVVSGVPQGSILGPLLFVLFINDMPSVAQHANVALFADDSKCYKLINSISDCRFLQKDLDALYKWSLTWELNFHPSKCQIISMSRRLKPIRFAYKMNGIVLEKVDTIKDLGVDISSKLDWNSHVNRVVKKSNRKMGMIMRTVGYNAPTKVTKTLYNALVRSDLEYGSCLWSGTSKHNINLIESVQRRATKFIMHYPDMGYKERLISLDMLPLSFRRELCDLTFFHRCKMEQYDINVDEYVIFNADHQKNRPTTRQSSDPFSLIIHRCKTESHKDSFFNRIVPLWNQLPQVIRACNSTSAFKGHVFNFLQTKFQSNFMSSNVCTWISACHCPNCRSI